MRTHIPRRCAASVERLDLSEYVDEWATLPKDGRKIVAVASDPAGSAVATDEAASSAAAAAAAAEAAAAAIVGPVVGVPQRRVLTTVLLCSDPFFNAFGNGESFRLPLHLSSRTFSFFFIHR